MLFHRVNAPYSKWYITGEDANNKAFCYSHGNLLDITIECLLDNSDHSNPTVTKMDVDFFSSEKGQGKLLHFEKVSSQEWKHNGVIVL
jgi:hypothetical protein